MGPRARGAEGSELWNFSLVDPNNRPVDDTVRSRMLAELEGPDPQGLLDGWLDGKLPLLWCG